MKGNKIEFTNYEKDYMRVLDKIDNIRDADSREKAIRAEARWFGHKHRVSPFVLMKEFRACFKG